MSQGELQGISAKQKIHYFHFDSISVDFKYFHEGLDESILLEGGGGGENGRKM